MNQANPVRTDLAHLRTEARNPRTLHIDTLPTPDMVRLMCEENRVVEDAVAAQAHAIAAAIDIIAARLDAGGHLIYVGAGTSGRLGVVDASECPPTFGVDDRLVRAVIAGGHEAMFHAIEGAEDSAERGAAELEADGVDASWARYRWASPATRKAGCTPCAMSSWHPTSDRRSSPAPRVSRQGQRRS